MIGKFFLLALLCVSLAQVQGNELEEAIKNGLNRVKGMTEGAQKKIDAAIKEVDYKKKAIERQTIQFVIKSKSIQDGAKEALRNTAQAMEEKAKETNKPESVFECIRKAEQNTNNRIQILTDKFKVDIERLEKVKLANIETDSKPLYGLQEALTVRYQRVTKTIQSCQSPSCVETAIKSFSQWLEQTYADIGRILSQVGTVVSNFSRDAANYFNNSSKQVVENKINGVRDIKNCVLNCL